MIGRQLHHHFRLTALGIAFVSLVLLCVASDVAAGRTRAIGGVRLIEAMEGALATVVARVGETRSLGATGHGAVLVVERALRAEFATGETLEVAWEELSPTRVPRFRTGERVLVSLQLLPGASIWLARLPDPVRRKRTLSVAMDGNAFLRSPSPASLLVLEHYLALPPELREGSDGIAYLSQLAARAEAPLAIDAVARLGIRPKLNESVVDGTARNLVTALLRSDTATSVQDALVDVIGDRQLTNLRPILMSFAKREAPAPPAVYSALAVLDGGLSAELCEKLLELGPGPYREVVASHAGGPAADRSLRSLIAGDPSAEVRSRAIERLATLHGEQAAESLARALHDREPRVRGAAAKQLGELGDPVIPELQRVVESADLDASRAAVAGLAIMGTPESSAALLEIAQNHPDESIRNVATLAIGGKIGHD